MALPVFADPCLIARANPSWQQIDSYQLNLNGEIINFQSDPTGQYGFKYDLAGKPGGIYTAKVRAHNAFVRGQWNV